MKPWPKIDTVKRSEGSDGKANDTDQHVVGMDGEWSIGYGDSIPPILFSVARLSQEDEIGTSICTKLYKARIFRYHCNMSPEPYWNVVGPVLSMQPPRLYSRTNVYGNSCVRDIAR